MTYYHVLLSSPTETTVTVDGQHHDMRTSLADDFATDPAILYVAEWDGSAPTVAVLKGDPATVLTMRWAGWPEYPQ